MRHEHIKEEQERQVVTRVEKELSNQYREQEAVKAAHRGTMEMERDK